MGTLPFSRKKTKSKQSSHSHSPESFKKLKRSFNNTCKPFKFINTFSSGSQALQWCMSTATFMHVDRLLIACGSYILGDNNSLLTHLGSSAETNNYGRIKCTELHPETELHTIALPYFIDANDERLETLEKECLNEIHSRCLYAKMKQDPIKAMVLELILNCTGGILSHHFLGKLAILSKMHDFYFIIDEIITAGRTGTFLYTLQMPKAFIDRVIYIALGKWLGMGAVLCNTENVVNVDFGRGETTGTNYNEALAALNLYSQHSDKALSRRAEVLKELNVDEENAWGKGILIYCNSVVTNSMLGIKGRYLPMLESLPFSNCTPRSVRCTIDGLTFNKKEANDHTINAVQKWLSISCTIGIPSY